MQIEVINYRDHALYIKSVTESDEFQDINHRIVLQPGKNDIEFQVSENIIEIYNIGEKILTLKIEYNSRTLFSEDYVIEVHSSLMYIAWISAPFVIIGLIFMIIRFKKTSRL